MARAKPTPTTSPARNGRAAPKQPSRTFGVGALSAVAAALGLGAALFAVALRKGRSLTNPAEHAAPDLAADAPPPSARQRAPDAFRPDPTAPVPPELRDSLRPAIGPAPSLAADRGSMASGSQGTAS
ncbi:MAG TPA: hypothetical protein VF649_11645 [Sphingomonas sp.]|jgi:hypothetical protein|uniref:hypothetical protein n=1 Tax=Sphingomonas sp. TaxID=28214 RepID=UPI002ED86E86